MVIVQVKFQLMNANEIEIYYSNKIKVMENVVKNKECRGCQAIQEIVFTNEQMIQAQIKLIKTLHEEILSLRNKNDKMEQFNGTIANKHLQQDSNAVHKTEASQQTDWTFEEHQSLIEISSLDKEGLKVSTKVNIKKTIDHRKRSMSEVNKENLHELLPIVTMSKDEEYFSRKRKNSFEEQHYTGSWLKIIHPKMVPICPSKFKQKTIHLVKRMVPHQIRHLVWPSACENSLIITDELYFQLQERKNLGWVSKEVQNQIQKDIVRSFTNRDNLLNKEGLKIEVCEVLQMFHLYRPDVSYVQGMTYPLIVLTLVVGKVKAFNMFSNIALANQFFRKLYLFQPKFVRAISRTFQMLLFDYHSQMAQKLAHQKIQPQVFLVEWFYTIFSRSLSFDGTLKFWDQLLYYGEVVLFRMALGIFELIKPHIMETNFENTVGLIQGFGSFIREDKLFDIVVHHKLGSDKVQKYLEKTERSLRLQGDQ